MGAMLLTNELNCINSDYTVCLDFNDLQNW